MTGHDDELERGRRDAGARSGEPISVEAFHGLAAAYALDALDHDERAEFERALAASPELRDEVDAYAESAAHLAEQGEPVAPPPSLKARLMAELDSTPQVAADAAPDVPEAAAPAPPVAPTAPTPSPTPAAGGSDRPVGRAESAARRRWFQRPGAIIGAAAAAVVLIAGAVIGIGWTGPNGWGAQREMAAIAEAPDAQSQTHEVEGGGEVTLVSSAAAGRSGVIVEGLPALDADQTYELWYIDDAGADSAGTFDVAGPETWRVLDGSFTPGVAVGITVEPSGGSPQPTTDPIVFIPT
ncbi:anti-sigma-K factor RskA [Agromyces ramosus]|uniref:Regulator of SigK n=1 Tax=Agromyces ramosus TaxID=33879 RepID=A0A4V2EYT6_9MICO|nr:anti-sigma factor [Agromyces ramosus]RZS64120.1 anti-sigma-K factor RskA [Agromyces ramosus]